MTLSSVQNRPSSTKNSDARLFMDQDHAVPNDSTVQTSRSWMTINARSKERTTKSVKYCLAHSPVTRNVLKHVFAQGRFAFLTSFSARFLDIMP